VTTIAWDQLTWRPDDPDRRCYTCGSSPTFRFRDGSPGYSCGPHPPVTLYEPYPWTPAPEIWVELDDNEREMVETHAKKVVEMDIAAGLKMYFSPGGGESRLDVNIRGYGAEFAASKWTGLPWNHRLFNPRTYRRDQKTHDIGRRVEVKNAIHQNGRLACSSDDPERVHLLLVGDMPRFRICGWMEGIDLHVPGRRQEPPAVRYAAYFARQADLKPMPLPDDA